MTRSQHIAHFTVALVLAVCAGVLELFTTGSWAHLAWAPAGVAAMKYLITFVSGLGGPPGPAAFVALLAWSALALNGCAHSSPPVTTFGHCATAAIEQAAQGILGRVTTALATGDYVDQVAAIATEVGAAEVGCAVDLVISEFKAKADRSNDTEVAVVLTHAQAWRGSNP